MKILFPGGEEGSHGDEKRTWTLSDGRQGALSAAVASGRVGYQWC